MSASSSQHGPLQGWGNAVDGALHELRTKSLLRIQRPTLPLLSSSQALIAEQDLQAWVSGQPPALPNSLSAAHWRAAHIACQYQPVVQEWSSTSHGGSAMLLQQPAAAVTTDAQPSASTYPLSQHRAQADYNTADDALCTLTLFSLNDYLGLASHPDVCEAAATAARQYGMGWRSSAIVGGTSVLHRELEVELAKLKATQDCLLFPTGFAANMAVVSSLASLGGPVAILSDELNHASIIDGARLALRTHSNVTLHVYPHNDMVKLDQILCGLPRGTRALVVTDSLFSMDGDFADLKALARLRCKHGFLLVVDEAHATLVCGEHGAGAAEAMGVSDQVDVHVGTLSKAFGSLGGFVATSTAIKELLVNKGRGYVYSTALPNPVVAGASAALAVSTRESWRRHHLWSLVHRLGDALGVPALSPVVPLVVGSEQEALRLGSLMLQQGMHVPAIRPPTVPSGTCRLRISLSAAHSTEDVDQLIHAVKQSGAVLQVLPHLVQQQEQHAREGWCMPFGWPADAMQHAQCKGSAKDDDAIRNDAVQLGYVSRL